MTDPLIVALASDLYRDQAKIMLQLVQQRRQRDRVTAAQRGGRLRGGRFLGLPVVEADVRECIVGVGYSDTPTP